MPKKPHTNQAHSDIHGSRPPLRPKPTTPNAANTRGLGKGLQALLGDSDVLHSITSHTTTDTSPDNIVAIDRITPSRWQPRQDFSEAELQELATSLRQHGIIQPLLVRPHPDHPNQFELIAGERRWRAAGLAQLHQVPVVIRQASNAQAAEIALIENIQRRDLNAIEEGRGYRQLIEEFGHTQEALAAIIGKSRAHLANSMRLLNLPAKVQSMLVAGVVTAGQVRPLIGRDDATELAELIVARGMTARQVETLLSEPSRRRKPKPSDPANDDMQQLAAELSGDLGLAVTLHFNSQTNHGSISIRTNTLDQFDSVVDKLRGP